MHLLKRLHHRFFYHSARTYRGTKFAFIPHEANGYRPHALRSPALKAYSAIILTVKLAVTVLVAFYPGLSFVSNVTTSNILALTNQARQSAGLSTLTSNGKLAQAAQAKANDMISNAYFAHTSPANVTPWDWFKRAGYQYKYAGENLGKDFATSEDLVQAWLDSPSHRKNIMNGNYEEIGIAVASGEVNGVSTIVIAQLFGAPLKTQLAAAPPASPPESPARPAPQADNQPEPQPEPEPAPAPPPPEPPATPIITSPEPASLVNVTEPQITGKTSSGATIQIKEGDQLVATAVADAEGRFQARPTQALAEGEHNFLAIASDTVTGLTSEPSSAVAFTVDATAPLVNLDQTVVIPAWEPRNTFDIFADIAGEPTEASADVGGNRTKLALTPLGFYGRAAWLGSAAPTAALSLVTTDQAANQTIQPLIRLDFFETDVLEPSRSLTTDLLLRAVLYSRQFFMAFLIFMVLALGLNILVRFRVQHQPTILYSLLLIYALTIMLVT